MDIKALVKVANRLDSLGLTKEADFLDRLVKKIAGEDTSFADQIVTNLKTTFSNMITSTRSKTFYSNSPLENMIRYIAGTSGPSMSDEDIVKTLTQSYDNTIGTGAYNRLSESEKMAFQGIIVNPLLDRAKARRGSASPPSESGVAMMEASTYPPAKSLYTPKESQKPSVSSPRPKVTMTDEQRWDAYTKSVPNGNLIKNMWIGQSGNILGNDTSFASFSTWLKSCMARFGIKNISAINLAGIMQREVDIKRAKDSDLKAKRQYSRTVDGIETSNSVEQAMEKAWNTNDMAEIKRLRDRLDIEER